MAGLIGFPDPVNETSARVVAGGVVAMSAATLAFDQPLLLVPIAYGFAARVLAGPKLSPLGQIATKVVTPRLPLEHKMVPGPPKRLAQGMGLVFSTTALALAATGRRRAAYRVLSLLVGAASLEAFCGFCIACRLFPLLQRIGIVRKDACPECEDLWGSGDRAAS